MRFSKPGAFISFLDWIVGNLNDEWVYESYSEYYVILDMSGYMLSIENDLIKVEDITVITVKSAKTKYSRFLLVEIKAEDDVFTYFFDDKEDCKFVPCE